MRDEHYILDICDEVLKAQSNRQARFDFLLGDTGRKLPVDAYYPELGLVIEYKEKQHFESVAFFDKRITASGCSRRQQRLRYDQRRRDILPKNALCLIELSYFDFEHGSNKRLKRNRQDDLKVVLKKLQQHRVNQMPVN